MTVHQLSYSGDTDDRELARTMVLQDLAGASGERLPVWDPLRGTAENRGAIVDPRSGEQCQVVGSQVPS